MGEQGNRRIGDYEILGVLGSGGMGQVFKVRNVISDRIEAMKIILPDLAGRQDLADRFLREIKLLAGLNHPNIAALRTALTVDNQLLMIMEYVEGTTVAARLEQGPLPVTDAVNYTSQVLEALSYAHQHNIIHRDIKPSNMMVTPEGVVKLMDFGIARSGDKSDLTATGATLGSLYYMSPEQVKGQPADARSDLYSLGASLYEMVTGERPFKADSNYSLMAAHIQQPPRPPIELRANLPEALNAITLLAMAKEPGQRFQTADAFRNALSTVQSAAPVAGSIASRTPAAAIGVDTMTASFAGVPPGKTGEWISTALPPLSQPVPVPSVMELSRQQSSNKGKYMALGGLLVVAFLVAAGVYIPRTNKTRAGENAARTEQKVSTDGAPNVPTDAGSSQPAANAVPPAAAPSNVDAGAPAQNPPAAAGEPGSSFPAGQGRTRNAAGGKAARAIAEGVRNAGEKLEIPSGGNALGAGASTPPLPDNTAALAELEQQVDQLSGRAVAVNDSLDNLRRQQSAQGLGLRGDIASTQERMKIHVDKAQAAVQGRDVDNAKKYAAQAEAELEQLEKFLGR
jgi:eukaryotic-like serine/threonine-protein kinase